ncbi:MAG: HAD family phosphatase [Cyclobacteriaceae bacterium]
MGKKEYDVIIFDLGEVIIDLNIDDVVEGFVAKSGKSRDEIVDLINSSKALMKYETGRIADEQFLSEVNELLNADLTIEQLKEVWNSMLGYLNPDKIALIKSLSDEYMVLILSNTNAIHEQSFNETVKSITGDKILKELVHTAHYSHDLKMRKPDLEIYEELNKQHQLKGKRVLFFDDKEENIVAAKQAGWDGIRVTYSEQVLDYFK